MYTINFSPPDQDVTRTPMLFLTFLSFVVRVAAVPPGFTEPKSEAYDHVNPCVSSLPSWHKTLTQTSPWQADR